MPKIDIGKLPVESATAYPDPHHKAVEGRSRRRLGNAVGLTQFGVNLTTLKPGAWSSQRHWHATEDEFVFVLEGELILKENHGETVLKPGDCAGWKANSGDGHCLINRTDRDAVYIEVGTRMPHDTVVYSDIDMRLERDKHGPRYLHKTGEPYPPRKV